MRDTRERWLIEEREPLPLLGLLTLVPQNHLSLVMSGFSHRYEAEDDGEAHLRQVLGLTP